MAEDLAGFPHFDQFAHQKEGAPIADTRSLLHIVGHDHHRVVPAQRIHQLLHFHGGSRVQRAGGLVHQKHIGVHSQCPGNAKALLLAARKAQGAFFQAILHFVPQGCAAQASFHDLIQLGLGMAAVQPGAIGDIVVNAHGKRICLLKHHANVAPQSGDIQLGVQNILAAVQCLAGDAHAGHQILHTIEGFQKSGFSAAGRADQGRDLLFGNLHGNAF